MSQSHIEAETTPTLGSSEMRDYQDYQRVLNVATSRCEEIERKIVALTAEHVELNVELAEVRKEIAHYEEARRTVSVVATGGNIIPIMLGKIDEALDKIEEFKFLPDTISLRLEALQLLPYAADSTNAAKAYKELVLQMETAPDPKLLAPLQLNVLDVVCLACCRHINPAIKSAYRASIDVAFGGSVDGPTFSKLGNSRFQLFLRDFTENPAKEQESGGIMPTAPTSRKPRRRNKSRAERSMSEPPCELRALP